MHRVQSSKTDFPTALAFALLVFAVCLPLHAPAQTVTPAGGEPQLVDRIVAIVDQEMILQSDLGREMELYRLERQAAGEGVDAPEQEIRQEILARLVESKLIIAAAKQAEITVDDEVIQAGVDERIDQLAQHFGSRESLETELLRSGMTVADYRSRLASQLRDQHYLRAVVGRFIRPKIEVLENEIARYYEEHLDEMPSTADSLTLANILIPVQPSPEVRRRVQQKVAQALEALQGARSFADVAKLFSEGPNAARGGLVGTVRQGELFDTNLENVIFTLEAGTPSPPIVTARGVHVVQVEEIAEGGRSFRQIFLPMEVREADVAAARLEAEKAHSRILAGEPFSMVASEVSADPASARRGGDLGTFRLEDLSVQFQESLGEKKAGELTDPLLTPAGFYFFLVKERSFGQRLPFDEVKDSLRRVLESEKIEAELGRYVDSLRDRYFIDLKG